MTQPPPPGPPNRPDSGPPQDRPPQDRPPQDQPSGNPASAPQDQPPGGVSPQAAAPDDRPGLRKDTPPQESTMQIGAVRADAPQGGAAQGGAPQGQDAQNPQPPQPPAPPAAPPQPGYGTPQTPPAPGQAPGAQPGYGYPQSPPAGQPSYGYPAQPRSNPYAQTQPTQPQAPYGYPQYGQPGQPGQPAQPVTTPMAAAAATRRRTNPQVAIIVAALVAMALIIGGGAWYSSSKDDGGKGGTTATGDDGKGGGTDGKDGGAGVGKEKVPADPASHVLFQVPAPEVKDDETYSVVGSWLTDKVYAKSGIAKIVGYDPAKGTEQWTIPLPGPVCVASRQMTEDHKTAIVFEPSMPQKGKGSNCSQIAAVDLDTGKLLWTKTAKSNDQDIRFGNVTVSGGTVAAGSDSGGTAFDIATGKELWAPKTGDECVDRGYAGGPALVAVRRCGTYDAEKLFIQTIDPKSGKVLSEYEMATGVEYPAVVSTDPLLVAADVGEAAGDGSRISDLFSIDNKTGKLRAKLSLPGDEYGASCDGISDVEECHQIVVGENDRLYVPTEERPSGDGLKQVNDIVAFDLATGKPTGQRLESEDGFIFSPLRMDGDNLLVYARGPYDKGSRVLSIDSGFKPTVLLQNSSDQTVQDVEISMQPDHSEYLFGSGRLYMAGVYAHKFDSSLQKEYLTVAFGTDG